MQNAIRKKARNIAKIIMIYLLILGRGRSPKSFKEFIISKLRFRYGLNHDEKQKDVWICKYKFGHKAAFCISIDFDNRRDEKIDLSNEGAHCILDLQEKFNIPITWAICGVTALKEKDVFIRILKSPIKNDVGVHTYSHIDMSLDSLPLEEIEKDISKCIKILEINPHPRTFIFPWNKENHFDLLRKLGFIAYRGRDRIFGYPEKNNDLWNVHPVHYIDEKSFGISNMLIRYTKLIIAYGNIFHLWFHPWNIEKDGRSEPFAKDVFEPLFQYADRMRKSDKLWICTLKELANYCESRQNCKILKYSRDKNRIYTEVSCQIRDKRFDFPPEVTIGFELEGFKPKNVLIDGKKIHNEASYQVGDVKTKKIFFTLSFEEPLRKIEILF